MGNKSSKPKKEALPKHFSHRHPLNLITHDPETLTLITSPCSACKLELSGTRLYSCTVCNDFFLHGSCFDMPKEIIHPFHKEHVLVLLSKPAYKEGRFRCDACGEKGKGFSYHCDPCGTDLHNYCAVMPFSVTHDCHVHRLKLVFGSLYANKKFSCAICQMPGSRQWLYRCRPCEFYAHLKCVRGGGGGVGGGGIAALGTFTVGGGIVVLGALPGEMDDDGGDDDEIDGQDLSDVGNGAVDLIGALLGFL
ncbi:hypothetical protein MIMGU_mgv1a022256mg, partial [Erythranthe guttata]